MSKNCTKILISCIFFSDFSDRLCKTFNSEERDQWKVQREIPSHSTDLDQAQKVREKNITKNCVMKKIFTLYMYLKNMINLLCCFVFFSIKRELKVITHTKVKLFKIFTWFIGSFFHKLTWNKFKFFLEIQVILLCFFFKRNNTFMTLSIKFFCYFFQCGLDLWIVAQAYVYFEKLILKVCYNYHCLTFQNSL